MPPSAIVTSSTARPSAQVPAAVVTTPAVVEVAGAHRSTARHWSITAGTGGPSIAAGPMPVPPSKGIVVSCRPWMWITDVGAGVSQVPSIVAESGPIAANRSVRHASV